VGSEVEVLADADRSGGFLVLIDRIRQSYVDLHDPTYLDFEYVQTFAAVLDTLPAGPLTVTHVGGGGCSFPRYVAHTRPRSSQIVFEPNENVHAMLRTDLPLPRRSGIRVRRTDGRSGMRALRDASADLVVVDAFDDGLVPAELTTAEFVADVARVLRPDGTLLMNVADGPPALFTRRLLATVRLHLPHVVLAADPAVIKRKRFGNVVLAASRATLATDDLARAAARSALPYSVLGPEAVTRLVADARPLSDEDTMTSPEPPGDSWRVRD
jgi:spermidine synthase